MKCFWGNYGNAAFKALNDVNGIKNVVINEGSGFDF